MKRAAVILLLGLVLLLVPGGTASGQTARITDRNLLGWYVYNGDYLLSPKWQVHTEYQWRRIDFVRTWQQSLARAGLGYQVSEKIQVGAGYTHFTTFPYGEHPVAGGGVPSREHRLHQQVQWADTVGRVLLSHRIRLEQRWLGQAAESNPRQITGWAFQHRVRYQLQAEVPLKGPTLDDKELYLTGFDELFMGFGRNVENNVFNQNRILVGLGYQVNDQFQLELGYLNQITQHAEADPLTGKPIFEINNGFRLNVNVSFDFAK